MSRVCRERIGGKAVESSEASLDRFNRGLVRRERRREGGREGGYDRERDSGETRLRAPSLRETVARFRLTSFSG